MPVLNTKDACTMIARCYDIPEKMIDKKRVKDLQEGCLEEQMAGAQAKNHERKRNQLPSKEKKPTNHLNKSGLSQTFIF